MAHSQPNLILSRLTASDFRLIEADLEDVDLPVRKVLEQPQRRIDSVYFPESGFASVVANGGGKKTIEVGIIGREGMTGLAVLLGSRRSKHETYMQAPGKGRRLKTSILRKAIDERATLHRSLLRYVNSFLDQAATTALANGRSTIEARLTRWLLMADDRVDGEKLPLTHEFLAMMLGVTRPGVTVAVQLLERKGLIERQRGSIVIIDRKALEKVGKHGEDEGKPGLGTSIVQSLAKELDACVEFASDQFGTRVSITHKNATSAPSDDSQGTGRHV